MSSHAESTRWVTANAIIFRPVKASKLYESGCRSLEDLRKPEYHKNLSSPVKVALDYVDHLGERTTRAEVEAVMVSFNFVENDFAFLMVDTIFLANHKTIGISRYPNARSWQLVST